MHARTGSIAPMAGRIDRTATRAFIAHGRRDPVMEVGFARRARELLETGGLPVEYHESDAAHQIDPAHLSAARAWLEATVSAGTSDAG